MRPKIKVFSLGGTIASSGSGKGVAPSLNADALVNSLPDLSDKVEIHAESFRQLPSPHISFDDIWQLVSAINRDIDLGADGIVVTHGTDTLEESAFLIDLLYRGHAPIILTGAMRNPTLPGADGPANLYDAVMVASDPVSSGRGVMLVFNSEIHSARYVQKCHTQNAAAFQSKPMGPIGWVAENSVRIFSNITSRSFLGLTPDQYSMGRVALLKTSMADDGSLIESVISKKYDGLVLEATGGGHVTPQMIEPITNAVARIPVVMVSRTGDGETLRNTYMFPGSEIDLLERGVLNGGWLSSLKARMLLSVMLGSGVDFLTIKKVFSSWLEGNPHELREMT